MLRILFVAMAHSIHTARWINQVNEQGWDIHLFPVENKGLHPNLQRLTVHDVTYGRPTDLDGSVCLIDDFLPFLKNGPLPRTARVRKFIQDRIPNWNNRAWRLA